MAKSFNLTAELNLRGPSNLGPVVSQIRKELGNISASVDIKVNKGTDRSLLTINNALNRLNNTLARTSTLSASTSSSIGDLTRSIDVLRNSLNGSTNSMTRVVASTRQVANQMSRTTRNIQQSSDAMEEFGRQSRLAVKRFAAFSVATGAIYALINAISKASSEFIEFDRQITRLTQITGESKDSLSKITDTITALSTNLGVTSSDLIKVSDTLAQAGLSAKQTEQALKALAASALAPSFDSLNDTVEGSIALMRQFKIGTQDLEKALGSINAVAAGFAVEASDIITAIQRSGGVFAAASKGVSEGTDALNEFIAVFTSVRATTRESAETIATGLRTIFTRIQRESTIDALKEYGVNLQDVEGKFVGAYKAVQLLSEGLGKLDPRDVKFSRIVEELGGFRQIGKVLPLIQEFATAQQALGVAERGQASLTKDVIKAQASLAIQFAKTREKFVALIRDIGNSGSFQALVKVGLTLADTFIKVVDVARPLLPIITALAAFKGGEALTKFVGGFIGGVRSGGGAGAVGNNIGQGLTGARARQGTTAAQNNLRGLTANTQALNRLVSPLDSLRASIVDLTNQIQSSQRAGGGGRGLSQGGVVKFARGGIVPGSGNSDTVPAMLQPGEFVIRKKAVETIGASNLQRMNRYAKGGPVVAKIANTKVADGDSLKVEFTPTGDSYNTLSRLEGWDAFETSSNVRGTKIPRWQRNLGKKATQVTQSEYEGNDAKALEAFKNSKGKHDVYGRPMFKDDSLGQKLFSMGLALPYSGRGQSPTKQMSLSDYKKIFGHAPAKAGTDTQQKMLGGLIQRLAGGGVAQRRVGYIDYDVISNPINEEIIKKGMKATGSTGPRLYADKLTQLAVQARKNSSIQKLKAIYGVAGSGKTTLARGQGTDDAKLRKTERFPILSPEDIERATEVLVLSSSVSKNKLDEIFSNADRTFTLSSTTKAERDRVRSQRDSRDITGIGLEGRTPGVTAGVSTDTAVGEALLADRLGSKSVVLGRGAGGNLRRKRGNELVEIIKKKIGFTWGSFSPMTAGHESIMDAAAAMGIAPEDFLYLVGSNEGIKAGDPSSYRTAVFDQDSRVMLAKAGAGARGAMVLPKPRDFEVPQGFDVTPEGSDRRKVLLPGKGSRTFVADKTAEQTAKYKEAGYSVSHIERTGGISGTMVRDLIMSGDMGKLQEVLSPGVYDIISSNINRLQNRARVLPDIIEQVKKSQESSLSDIEQQMKALGISRIDNKKAASDPEYAAKVEILQELRAKRDKIKSAGSFEPYKLLAEMARKEPEKYGLDFSTSSSTLKPIRTVSSQSVQKAAFGGLIKSLANSGMLKRYAEGDEVTVDEAELSKYGQIGVLAKTKIQAGKDILQAIKDTAVEQLSAIGGESKLRTLTPIPANLTRRFRKNLIEDGTLDLIQVSKVLSDALSSKGTGDAAEAERIAGLTKTAIVGLQPLDYNKNFNWKLGDKGDREVYTYVRGFSSEFLPEVANMQRKSAAMSKEFSENIEMKAALGPLSETRSGIVGPLRPLAIDFDNTLALGSRMTRMVNDKEEEDIPAYGDLTKVSDSLSKARPSALAKRLADVEKLNPGILRRFTRILTARPQSTAELISSTLNSWGLPYESSDITGLSQDVGVGKKFSSIPQAKAANLAQIEKLIDDANDNIKEAKKQGKEAYQYGEIPSISDNPAFQEKMGQGNIEGSALESALAFKLGYPINLDALQRNRAVDFPQGLGRGAQLFGIDSDIPTEVKRTLDGSSFEKAREEFYRFFQENPQAYRMAGGGLVKLYHGSNTGTNDSVLNSFKAHGAKADIAQGYGQGAGFYVWSDRESAKRQAEMRVKGGLGSFAKVSGDTAGRPMIVTVSESLDPATWDLDYEMNKGAVVKWLYENYGTVKDILSPSKGVTGIKDVIHTGQNESGEYIMSPGLRVETSEGTRKSIYSGTPADLREGQLVGELMNKLQAHDGDLVGKFENQFFKSPSLASGDWPGLALKYVGSGALKPTNIEILGGDQKGTSSDSAKPEKKYGKIGLRSDGNTINATYFKNDQREGYVSAYKMRDYLYYVGLSKATQGYGPRLYDAVMEEATAKGAMLTSDRSSVSGAARKIWDYYFKNRSDVKKTPLKPDDWTRNQSLIDPKLYGKEDTWPESTDPAWVLQSGYSKSPSLINDKDAVMRMSDKVDSGSMALQYFQRRALGGLIKRFAKGGQSEDTVPALLTPGEFVINKKAAERIGYGKLHNLNRADKIQGYNKGGVVDGIQRLNVGGNVVTEAQMAAVGKAIDQALSALPKDIRDAVDRFGEATNQINLGDTFDAINKKLRQQLTAALRDIDNLGPEVVEGIRTVLGAGVKALNTLELNTIKASPSYKPTDDATRDRVDDAKQARRAYQSRPVAGKTLMDYMRDQIGSPTPISSSRGRSAADYERMLDYSDVTGQRRDIGDSGRAYAAQLAKMDPQSVDAIAKAMREEFTKAMGAMGAEPSASGRSQSWALWEIGKQSFMNENPNKSSSKYRLADPLKDAQVRREGVQRMVGWEAERAEGKRRPSSSNVLKDRGAELLDSVGFQFTELADTAQQLDKQIDITKIKLQSIAEVLSDIPAPSVSSPGSPPSGGGGGGGGGGSPPAGGGGTPPGGGGGGSPPNSGGRFVSRRRAQFNALTQANKDYESAKDFGKNMLLLGSVVTGGLGVFKQFFSKTSLVNRGLDSLANSAGAVTGAFVAVTEGTDLVNKLLTSKQTGSLVKSVSDKLASSGIGDKIASLGQRGGRLSGTGAGTLARRTGAFLNRGGLGQLANPRTAAAITNTITKLGKLAAPAAAVASGLYAAANAFADITDQIRKNKEELLANQVDKGLQRFDQALAEYTKNTVDNGNQLAGASATLAGVVGKQSQLADISKTNPKYGLTNIIGEGVGGLGGLLQGGGSLVNSITEAMGMKTRIGGSGMEGVSQRAEILDKQGVMAYLGSLLDVTGRTQYQNAKKLAPEQAFDTSKLFQPLLEKQNAVVDAKFKKGQTATDIMGGADWKAQAEIIARSNAAVEEQTRLIDADLSVSKSARQAKIDEIRSNYAANELKKREISYLREKQGKQLDRESKDYTNSLNRMFDNMEQAIDATSFKLEKMADAIDLASNSLTGSAKVGGVKLDAINILKNPNIYGTGESNQATNMASSFFGDDKKTVGALLSVGPKIEKTILSTINTTLAENSDASEGKISAKINNAISEDLDKLNLGKGIREKLSKQISDSITEARKNGEEKIDFSDLSEKVPALARSIDAAKRAQDTAIKALEFYQAAVNNYAEGVNKTVDLIISANDRLREAQSIRVRSEIELAKTLGKKISLDTVKGAARASAESKAGTSDPFKIFNNINRLEGVRRFQQENMNNAANKGLSGSRDVKAFGSQLGQTTMQLKENYSALKNLAENTEVASAALEKISELKAKNEAGLNILEKYITSGPRDQIKLSQAFQRLENNMNGQTNNIMESVNVQQAYNDAIANGASISEANLAAQNAGAEDRGATLDAFNMIAPFLGDRQGEMKANVLESMMKESGVQMTPMFNQVLQSLRNPEADPQMSEAINEYRKAVELQAKANEYLGRLDSRLAIEVGQNTAAAFDQSASAKSLFAQAQKSDISNGILNSINVKLSDGTQKTQVVNTDKPRTLSRGGAVYMDVGGSIFQPKGTDTVPAMLTPGEFVVNRASAQANKGILSSINRGAKYYADGGWVSPDLNAPDEKRERGGGPYTIYDTFWTLGQSADIAKNIEKINSVQENIALLKPYSFPAFNKIPDDAFQSGYITHTSIKDKLLNSSYIAGESIAGIMPDFYMSKNVGSAALSGAGIGATAGAAGTVAAKGVAAAKAAAQNADGLLGGWLKKILGTADEAEAAVKPANWPTEGGFAPGFKGSLDEAVAAKKAEEAARKGATAVDAATKAADVSTAGSVINAKNIAALGWEATKFVPVLGSITGGIDAVRAFARGDIAGGLMETFGALAGLVPIPGVGAVGAGVARLGGRLLKFLNKGPVARALGRLTSLGAGAFGSIWSWGKKFGGNIFKNIGESKLFQGIASWLPKTKGGFFSTLIRNTGIGAVAGGTLGAVKAAVYDDQTPYITKSVQAKIKELLVTDLPKVSPEILKLGSVESIPGFSDKDTDFLTKDEWIAQKKAVSQWIDALSIYSEWNKVTKSPQSKEVFGINEGAYTEYLMGPRKITADKSYASVITGKTLSPDMVASQLAKPASDAWLKFKPDGYPGGETKLNKTTDAILAEQTKGMQMLSESAITDESFMKAKDVLKKYYDTEIGSLNEAKDFTDKPPTEQKALKRSAKLQELMKGLTAQVSFKKEEIDNKAGKFGLEGSDSLEVYSPTIYNSKVWQSLFSEIKKIEDENGFADGTKPVADKLLFDPSKPEGAFMATKEGQIMGMPWSASKFQIDQKWTELAKQKEEAAIAKFVGLEVGNMETYAKRFTAAKTNEDIPVALTLRKIKRIPLVDMETGNESGAIEGGLFVENRAIKSAAAGFNPFYSMNAGLPKPYATSTEELDSILQGWVDANFTSMDPTMIQLMAEGGQYQPVSGPSEGFLPVVKVEDKSRGAKRREAKASMTEGALPRLKFLTEKGMLFDNESRKVLTAADYYEGLDNFKEYMPQWIKDRMISTKLAKSAKDITAENTLGFRDQDLPKLGDAIWQEVSNLDLPIKPGLQTAGDWKGLLSRDYGIESPDKIADEETLHQGVDYLGGIKQKVLEVTGNMNKEELNKAAAAESSFQTYMSALDFLYKISGGKGSNKGLSKTASDFVYKKYRSKVFDPRTGKRIPGSPFVNSETTTAVQGPAKDEGLRFQGSKTGLTTEFWNVDTLLADAEFKKYILGYAKGRRSSQKLRSILTKGKGNEDLGEVDKSGLNNALKEAAKRTGISDQSKEDAAGAKIVSENGELKSVEMPTNIIDVSKQLTNDREIYDPVYRHALGETVLRYGDEGAKYWTQKPGDNTALAAWGTLWNEYRAKIQDMMLYLEQKDDLLFMPVSKGRTEIFPPAIAPLAGKVSEALGGLDLTTIAESLMSDPSGMGIYNMLPDAFKGDPAKEQELLNSLKTIYSNNFDPNSLPHVYSEQGFKSYELMKQVYDAANEAYLLFSEFNDNLGTELIPPPIVYRPEEFAYGQLSEYGKALMLVKNNNASTIFEALQKQLQVDQQAPVQNMPAPVEPPPTEPQTLARGGIVYRAAGGIAPVVSSVDFSPKGSDTVPAMLTPGEFVVNRSSTAKFRPVLEAINSGAATSDQITQYVSRGSYIKPKYYADGGNVTGNSVAAGVLASIGLSSASIAALESFNKSASLLSETLKNLNIGNITLSQESIEAINSFSNKFDGFVQSLLKVSIPPVITLTAKHDVNVNINGISVLKNIEGMVQQTVIAEVDKALNEMSRKNEGSFER